MFNGESSRTLCRTCFYIVINRANYLLSFISMSLVPIMQKKDTLYELTTSLNSWYLALPIYFSEDHLICVQLCIKAIQTILQEIGIRYDRNPLIFGEDFPILIIYFFLNNVNVIILQVLSSLNGKLQTY